MKKEENKIGLFGATAYTVGTIIGSGIFIAPKGIVEHAGSVGLSLIIWVVCALLSAITAINYIELGTSIPESGSDLAYISFMGWTPAAFSFMWLSVLIQSSSSGAVLFMTFGEYIVEALEPVVCMDGYEKVTAARLFGFGLLLWLTLTNMFALSKFASNVQIMSMISKIVATSFIIGIGFFFMIFRGQTEHYSKHEIMKGSNFNPGAIVLAIYQGNWAYAGFNQLNMGVEEVQLKNFRTTLPLAIIGGLGIAAVIYLLVNVAYFAILTPQEIIDSSAVATTFIQKTVGDGPAFAVPAVVGLLLVGTLNGDIFGWSRTMTAGARRRFMPTIFALIHADNDSPRVSVLAHTMLCIGFSFIGDTDTLVNYLTITGTMTTICSLVALVVIKWKKIPVADTAFHIFWPVLNVLINVALLVIPIQQDPVSSSIGLGFFIGGVVVYFATEFLVPRMKFLYKVDESLTYICQVFFWTVVDEGPKYKKVVDEVETTRM